jgi:hypothetical protein
VRPPRPEFLGDLVNRHRIGFVVRRELGLGPSADQVETLTEGFGLWYC